MIVRSFLSTTRNLTLCALVSSFALTGCDLANNQLKMDRASNMEFQDYRDALAPRLPDVNEVLPEDSASIPKFQDYVADPSDKLKAVPLVSISVNQTIPLRDALFELAEQADYDMELDPRIRGSIIFTARNKPFDIVIDRICDIAGLRYKFKDDVLRVEMDTPYHEIYNINYLSYIRRNESGISNNVAVVSAEGADTGSRFTATSESEADFWGELETNLTQIIGAENASQLRTSRDPRISAVSNNPAPVEPLVITEEGEITVPEGSQQPPNAVLRVDSLPTDELEGDDDEGADQFNAQFSVNRQAGMVSIFANERVHGKISKYLQLLERSVTSQVLIEAKVLEVALSDEYSAGIDWRALNFGSPELSFGYTTAGDAIRGALSPAANPLSEFELFYLGDDFNLGIEAISRFGTVQALASPRLTVLNNQSAVLNVADNQVYFEIDIQTTVDDGISETEIDTEIRNVPEGVLINVQPSIDLDNETVSMAIRPTVTRIIDQVADPGVAFVVAGITDADAAERAAGIESLIPVVNVQEMDSVVRLGSGQTIVMGGLMQDRVNSTQTGVPVLSEIPLLGNAFKHQNDEIIKSELVIFIRATIVEGADTIHETDKDLYRTFSDDRRPIKF